METGSKHREVGRKLTEAVVGMLKNVLGAEPSEELRAELEESFVNFLARHFPPQPNLSMPHPNETWGARCDECGWDGQMADLRRSGTHGEITHCPACESTAIVEDIPPQPEPEGGEEEQQFWGGMKALRLEAPEPVVDSLAQLARDALAAARRSGARAERERLQWSRDLPTEHGEWYFVRVPGTDRTECVFVTVDNEYPDHLIAGGYAMSDAHPDPRLDRAYADCEWAGPLTPPREEPRT